MTDAVGFYVCQLSGTQADECAKSWNSKNIDQIKLKLNQSSEPLGSSWDQEKS